ncbi:MAG: hypothetical protein A4E56_00128 [Pelotomaculum sp. PtaU1.Bin065]|nr:MAG: hypothetical protein A4E56_00128 [Pelotomaculum sp. PtaU1.Bin065]
MINPGLQKYEFVLNNQYYLRELLESIILEDSLDEIAYRATVRLAVTSELQKIGISPGQVARVSGVPFGGSSMVYLLHPGVVWECDSQTKGLKHLTATIYDRSIYISKSEEEYLFPAGQTATQRISQVADEWGIPLKSNLADTSIILAKSASANQKNTIWGHFQNWLKETVAKGGDMYRPRMTPDGLELFKIGSNKTVWVLESDQNLEEISQKRTLEGAVTRVKVVGNAAEGERSPVLAVVDGETSLGTLQKLHSDEKITDAGAARTAGQELLAGIQETFNVQGIDINTIRAGDKVQLNSIELIVVSVRHELGSPGHMSLELLSEDFVRRRYFEPV